MLKTAVRSLTLSVKFVSIFLIFVVRENGSQEAGRLIFIQDIKTVNNMLDRLPGIIKLIVQCMTHYNNVGGNFRGIVIARGNNSNKPCKSTQQIQEFKVI